MAITKLSDIVDPEMLASQASAKFPDKLVFGNTSLVRRDPNFVPGAPGSMRTIPFWKKIGQFVPLVEGVALIPGRITSGKEHYVIKRSGIALGATDISELVSATDPVTEMASQIGQRAAEDVDASFVDEIEHSPNVFDQTSASVQTNSDGIFDQNVTVNGMLTLGDNYQTLVNGGQLLMHSKVYADLLKNGYIQNNAYSGSSVMETGNLPRVMGIPIHISDRVKTTTVTVNSVTKIVYHSYLVGPEALMLGYQRELEVEMARDILLKADILSADMHYSTHLFGWDDQTSAIVAEQTKTINAVVIKSF